MPTFLACVDFYQRLQECDCLPSAFKSLGPHTAEESLRSTDLDLPLLSKLMIDTSVCSDYEHICPEAHEHHCKSCQRAVKAWDKDRKDDEKFRKMIKKCKKWAKELCETGCEPESCQAAPFLNGLSNTTAQESFRSSVSERSSPAISSQRPEHNQESRSTAPESLLLHLEISSDDSVCDLEHQQCPKAHKSYCKDCVHAFKSLLKDPKDDEKQEKYWKKCIKHDKDLCKHGCLPTYQCQQLSSLNATDLTASLESRHVFADMLSEDSPDPRTPLSNQATCKELRENCHGIDRHDCKKCAKAYEDYLEHPNSPKKTDKMEQDCVKLKQQWRRSGCAGGNHAADQHRSMDEPLPQKEITADVKLRDIPQGSAASASCDALASKCSSVSIIECQACKTALVEATSLPEIKRGCLKFTEQVCADQGTCSGLTESECATDLQLLRDIPDSPAIPEHKAVSDDTDIDATTLESSDTSDLSSALLAKRHLFEAVSIRANLLSHDDCMTSDGYNQCIECAVGGEGCKECRAELQRCGLDDLLPLFAPPSTSSAVASSTTSALSTSTEVSVETAAAPTLEKRSLTGETDWPCDLLSCKGNWVCEDKRFWVCFYARESCCETSGKAQECFLCQHDGSHCKEFFEQFRLCGREGDISKFPGLLDKVFPKSSTSSYLVAATPTIMLREHVTTECNHSTTATEDMSLTASTSSETATWYFPSGNSWLTADPSPSPSATTREPAEPKFEDWPCDRLGDLHCYAATGACTLCKMTGNGCELFNALLSKCSKTGEGNNDLALIFPGLPPATEREHDSPSTTTLTGSDVPLSIDAPVTIGPMTPYTDPSATTDSEDAVDTNVANITCAYLAVAKCYEAAAACAPCKMDGVGCEEYTALLNLCAEENDWNDHDDEELRMKLPELGA